MKVYFPPLAGYCLLFDSGGSQSNSATLHHSHSHHLHCVLARLLHISLALVQATKRTDD